MTYPTIAPTSRQFNYGDWPVKKFQSQNGAEVRILYGDRRVGHTLSLTYKNIPDTTAELFLRHFESMKGTYETFVFPQPITSHLGNGWKGDPDIFKAGGGVQWRYKESPQVVSVYPGVSTVSVSFIAVGYGGF